MLTEKTEEADLWPGTRFWVEPEFLGELGGGLWHATPECRWIKILASGQIRPDAPAPFNNGFCRSIGAVSLFDLAQPDDAARYDATKLAHWLGKRDDETRYWIEIDREATVSSVLDPAATCQKFRQLALNSMKARASQEGKGMQFIAGMEAAHVGPIPLYKTKRVLQIRNGSWVRA